MQWCGSWGYSAIALTRKFLSYYVRARHYAAILGNWTSVDPLWPQEMAYGYVENRVMTGVDYWGMKPHRETPYGFYWDCYPGYDDRCTLRRDNRIRITPNWNPGVGGMPGPTQGRSWPGRVGGNSYIEDWAYGDYCGKNNWKKGCDRPEPKDCVDAACQKHDDCLESASYFLIAGSSCHCNFLMDVKHCLVFGGCLSSKFGYVGAQQCYAAATHIYAAFSFICPGTSLSGLGGLAIGRVDLRGKPSPAIDPYSGFEDPNSRPGAIIPKPGGVGSWRV